MAMQLRATCYHNQLVYPSSSSSSLYTSSSTNSLLNGKGENTKYKAFWLHSSLGEIWVVRRFRRKKQFGWKILAQSGNATLISWDDWKPDKGSESPSLSDVIWPAAGAFAAMAVLGKMDQMLAQKGVSMTIAPFGAVCAVLFAAPSSPAARKYNMFMAQIGCAAFGVLAFSILGPGWLARSSGVAAAVAFMISTRAIHPPAASLPLLFLDGAKFHHLNFWFAFFPGAAGCILLCLIQEVVCYLKNNIKF